MRGLLKCEMLDTVRGTIDNFASLIERYGFVPNGVYPVLAQYVQRAASTLPVRAPGTRVYYLNRSQPPMLAEMVDSYLHEVGAGSGEIPPHVRGHFTRWLKALDSECVPAPAMPTCVHAGMQVCLLDGASGGESGRQARHDSRAEPILCRGGCCAPPLAARSLADACTHALCR